MAGKKTGLAGFVALLGRLGVCGNSGLIVGSIAGGILGLLSFIEGDVRPTNRELLGIWLLLAAFCWIILILVFRAFVRWPIGRVAVPALVNSFLVTGLTVLLTHLTGLYAWAFFIGVLAGLVVGYILCQLYRRAVGGGA